MVRNVIVAGAISREPGGDLTGTVSSRNFSAVSQTEIMGQKVDLGITGTVDGDSMTGSINAGMPGLPDLPFTGKRGA